MEPIENNNTHYAEKTYDTEKEYDDVITYLNDDKLEESVGISATSFLTLVENEKKYARLIDNYTNVICDLNSRLENNNDEKLNECIRRTFMYLDIYREQYILTLDLQKKHQESFKRIAIINKTLCDNVLKKHGLFDDFYKKDEKD